MLKAKPSPRVSIEDNLRRRTNAKSLNPMADNTDTALADIARRLAADYVGEVNDNNRILVAIGTLGADVWRPGDPIDLVCFTSNTAAIFWAVVGEAFGILNIKVPRNASLKLRCESIKPAFGTSEMTIRYCPFPANFQSQDIRREGIPSFDATRSVAENRNLAMAQDAITMNLLESCTDVLEMRDLFRSTYDLLHAWFTASGLLHRPSGYLDSEGLLCLLYNEMTVWMDVRTQSPNRAHDQSLIEYFFMATSVNLANEIAITTPHDRILSSHITSSAARTIKDAITLLTHHLPSIGGVLTRSAEQAYQDFIIHTPAEDEFFTLATESYSTKTSELYDFINNLPLKLVVYMRTRPDLRYRIWPHPLVRISPSDGDGIHVTYIVAVHDIIFNDFETLLAQAQEAMMHQAESHIIHTVSHVQRRDTLLTEAAIPPSLTATLTNLATAAPTAHRDAAPHDPSRPFRTASKALSRAKHDPVHRLAEFEVGYLDRFDGLQWLPLAKWGNKATEEEDFIPEHRVQKLRRVVDDLVVWDRQARRDWL